MTSIKSKDYRIMKNISKEVSLFLSRFDVWFFLQIYKIDRWEINFEKVSINFILKSWESRTTNIVVKRVIVLIQSEKNIIIKRPPDYDFEIYDWDLIELSLIDLKIEYMIKDNTWD